MTNTVPAWAHLLMVAFVAASVGVRLLVLPLAPDNWRLTCALGFGAVALALKDPVAGPAAAGLIGAVDVRLVVHVLVMAAAVAVAGLPGAWRMEPPGAQRRRYALVLAAGAAMWLLAVPARGRGLAVEAVGGWWSVAYFTLFAAPTAAGLLAVAAAFLRQRRHVGRGLAPMGGALAVLVVLAADALSMLASAMLRAAGLAPQLTSARQGANGWLFAVMMVLAAVVCLRPVATHRREGPGGGLRALWEAVTEQAPGVVLSRPHTLSPQVRRLRMECEVIDALRELEPYLPEDAGSGAGRPGGLLAAQVAAAVLAKRAGALPARPGRFEVLSGGGAPGWRELFESAGPAVAAALAPGAGKQAQQAAAGGGVCLAAQ